MLKYIGNIKIKLYRESISFIIGNKNRIYLKIIFKEIAKIYTNKTK